MNVPRAWFLLVCLLLGACRAMASLHDPNDSFPTADDTPKGVTEEEWHEFQEARAAKAAAPDEVGDIEVESAAEALELLLAGNARFVAGRPRHDHESLRRRAMLAGGQHPFAVVLGCADSRVPPELIFDAGLGDLFVIRVAGNVAGTDEAGSIEYAIAHLETKLVLVLGHEGCGAITAAIDHAEGEARELTQLLASIGPGLSGVDASLPREERIHQGVEANVRAQLRLMNAIADREGRQRAVSFVGAVYELETGQVRILQ